MNFKSEQPDKLDRRDRPDEPDLVRRAHCVAQAARREEREDLLDKVSAEAGYYFTDRGLEQCSC